MRFALVLVSWCVLLAPTAAMAADEPSLPPEAQAALDKYIAGGAKLQQDAEARHQAVRAKLLTALDALQTSEAKAGHLDAALAVKKLHDGLQSDATSDPTKVPPDAQWPKAVPRALDSYQSDSAKLDKELAPKLAALRDQAVRDLESIKVAQTKAGQLDAALLIKQTQEQLRSGQAAAGMKKSAQPSRVLTFAASAGLQPVDDGLLRKGGATSTLEFMVASLTKDGVLFRCGGGGNGQSVALVGDEVWYAMASPRHGILVKAPLNGTKPPFHLAVTFKDGDISVWVNGVLAKKEASGVEAIADNATPGGLGDAGGSANNPAMPRQGFEGSLAGFRYVDKVLYDAPFSPSYPFPAAASVRWAIDAATMEPGAVKEFSAGGVPTRPVGEIKVTGR